MSCPVIIDSSHIIHLPLGCVIEQFVFVNEWRGACAGKPEPSRLRPSFQDRDLTPIGGHVKTGVLVSVVLLSLAVHPDAVSSQSNGTDPSSYVDSIRADTRVHSVAIITDAMHFSESESASFWPVYWNYEAALTKIEDQQIALAKSFVDHSPTMTNAAAQALIEEGFELELRRIEAEKKCIKDLKRAGLPALTVARFVQLEHRLNLMIDVQITAQLPPLVNDHPVANK